MVSKKHSLTRFAGTLSEESAEKLEKAIKEFRARHTKSYARRVEYIVKSFEEMKENSGKGWEHMTSKKRTLSERDAKKVKKAVRVFEEE
ncbi:MAG: hypothetical protein HYW25_04130 [Candidatus Aenigmarchaeota archaeon]|nr:hypothetical protein [Candidatus Aenigmarchaeota archaeon]